MTDVFRQELTPLSEEQRKNVKEIKVKAQELYNLISPEGVGTKPLPIGTAIYIQQAQVRLQEAVMLAVYAHSAPEQSWGE